MPNKKPEFNTSNPDTLQEFISRASTEVLLRYIKNKFTSVDENINASLPRIIMKIHAHFYATEEHNRALQQRAAQLEYSLKNALERIELLEHQLKNSSTSDKHSPTNVPHDAVKNGAESLDKSQATPQSEMQHNPVLFSASQETPVWHQFAAPIPPLGLELEALSPAAEPEPETTKPKSEVRHSKRHKLA